LLFSCPCCQMERFNLIFIFVTIVDFTCYILRKVKIIIFIFVTAGFNNFISSPQSAFHCFISFLVSFSRNTSWFSSFFSEIVNLVMPRIVIDIKTIIISAKIITLAPFWFSFLKVDFLICFFFWTYFLKLSVDFILLLLSCNFWEKP